VDEPAAREVFIGLVQRQVDQSEPAQCRIEDQADPVEDQRPASLVL
jgi:hypothetical protein